MLKDCMEIFDEKLQETKKRFGDEERLILDEYIPAEGDYLIVKRNGEIQHCSIVKNKQQYEWNTGNEDLKEAIQFYDYHSRLVSSNKPLDLKKIILSNNYFSFWVKWESLSNGKLNPNAIDRYFDVLKDPKKKYKKVQDRKLYNCIAEQVGDINEGVLESNRKWIHEHIFDLDAMHISFSRKLYLKIFFEADKEQYINEEKRYLMVNIFNSNDYNLEIDGRILGVPTENLGLNAKKPFLETKTRKSFAPHLITLEEAIKRRMFFDYLMNKAQRNESDVFFENNEYETKIVALKKGKMPGDDFSGYYLRINKGIELEILHQDTIVDYKLLLDRPFNYQNVLDCNDDDKDDSYQVYKNRQSVQDIINTVLFNKYLAGNYFTEIDKLPKIDAILKHNLIWSRGAIFEWLYNGRKDSMPQIFHKLCMNMMKYSISNGYMLKAKKQFNLMSSFDEYFGGKDMSSKYNEIREKLKEKINQPINSESAAIDTDEEYFYAVGQAVNYLIYLSKAKNKAHSLANPFFNATNDDVIKSRLRQLFVKYDYALRYNGYRFNQLYALIADYEVNGKVSQEDIIAGYISRNIIFESNKQDENNSNGNETSTIEN